MKHSWTRYIRPLLVLIPLAALALLAWRWWPYPREAVYSLYRDRGRSQTLSSLQGYNSQTSEHFDLYYKDADKNTADLILTTAESVYGPVVKRVGFEPSQRVPLIVYSSRDEMRSAFGWGQSESAMGVYWKGTIRLLSPNVWIHETSPAAKRKVFRKINPISHELTHYVLDYMTNGNYPRWFTEGLAQYVEYKVTGYLWLEPQSTLKQNLYTLQDLDGRFDQLHNQPLAYRQSFLLVDYMARTYGEEGIGHLLKSLAEGVDFQSAVKQSFGVSEVDLYRQWESWVQANLKALEAQS